MSAWKYRLDDAHTIVRKMTADSLVLAMEETGEEVALPSATVSCFKPDKETLAKAVRLRAGGTELSASAYRLAFTLSLQETVGRFVAFLANPIAADPIDVFPTGAWGGLGAIAGLALLAGALDDGCDRTVVWRRRWERAPGPRF